MWVPERRTVHTQHFVIHIKSVFRYVAKLSSLNLFFRYDAKLSTLNVLMYV